MNDIEKARHIGQAAGILPGTSDWEEAKRLLVELANRVTQLQTESDADSEINRYFFRALGFSDWDYTMTGAEAAIKALKDLVTGKVTPDTFGRSEDPDDLGSLLVDMLEKQR